MGNCSTGAIPRYDGTHGVAPVTKSWAMRFASRWTRARELRQYRSGI